MIGMMCIEKECKHREFNGGDEKGDFYTVLAKKPPRFSVCG